jgi:hypothetical protein
MNRLNAKEELLRNAIRGGLTEEDALLWMALLHTHEIHLRPGTVEDLKGNGTQVLAADTQRGAAEVVAALWRKRSDSERSNYTYWYVEYNRRLHYEVFEDVPPPHRERIRQFREALTRDDRVLAVRPEN